MCRVTHCHIHEIARRSRSCLLSYSRLPPKTCLRVSKYSPEDSTSPLSFGANRRIDPPARQQETPLPGSSRLRETIVRSPPVALHSERDAPYEVDIFGSRIPDQIGEKSQLHTFGSFDLPVFTGVQENVLNIEIAVYAVSPDGIPRNHAHAGPSYRSLLRRTDRPSRNRNRKPACPWH